MNWTAAAAILLALAVGIGAFGAHGLQGRLDPYSMEVYERAVIYHFFHALGLLVVPLLAKNGLVSRTAANWASWFLLAGIVLFSGSLYLYAITNTRAWGIVAPFGGTSFIVAWIVLAVCALKSRAD